MALDLALSIYDPDKAERLGKPGEVGINFRSMTVPQAQAGLAYLRSMASKLEEFIEREGEEDPLALQKHGAGEGKIIPEDDDNQKIAKQNWSDKDEAELHEELAQD